MDNAIIFIDNQRDVVRKARFEYEYAVAALNDESTPYDFRETNYLRCDYEREAQKLHKLLSEYNVSHGAL